MHTVKEGGQGGLFPETEVPGVTLGRVAVAQAERWRLGLRMESGSGCVRVTTRDTATKDEARCF